VIRRQGGGRLGSFRSKLYARKRVLAVGCQETEVRGVYSLATGVDLALNCN